MSGLKALNTFSTPSTQALGSLSSWPSSLRSGNQGVHLGEGVGGVNRVFKSETMCHNIRGLLLGSSLPFFPILNATVLLFYWIGAAFSEMGDLFL